MLLKCKLFLMTGKLSLLLNYQGWEMLSNVTVLWFTKPATINTGSWSGWGDCLSVYDWYSRSSFIILWVNWPGIQVCVCVFGSEVNGGDGYQRDQRGQTSYWRGGEVGGSTWRLSTKLAFWAVRARCQLMFNLSPPVSPSPSPWGCSQTILPPVCSDPDGCPKPGTAPCTWPYWTSRDEVHFSNLPRFLWIAFAPSMAAPPSLVSSGNIPSPRGHYLLLISLIHWIICPSNPHMSNLIK